MSRLVAPGSSRLARPGLRPPSTGLTHPPQAKPTAIGTPQRTVPSSKDSVDSGSTTPGSQVSFECGDRVVVGGTKQGTVAFVGTTQFARGLWVGVALDTPDGKNNGSVKGVSYFQCESNYGLFSKPEKLEHAKKTLVSSTPTRQTQPPPSRDSQLRLGDKVVVDGVKSGVVLFIGQTQFAKGPWIGVYLDEPDGKNNGYVDGVQYFECPPHHGVFTRPNKVTLLLQQQGKPLPVSAQPHPIPPQISAEEMKAKASHLHLGDRVFVNGNKEGTLRFIGPTHFAKGIWVGVELDVPQGKNDGAVSGKRYFQCEPQFGLFAPLPKVEKIADAQKPSVLSPPQSNQCSRKLSESSVSSISSLSSLGKLRQQQQPLVEGIPRGTSPTNAIMGGSIDNLSHILFEKDHQIATLQSSLDLSEQEKMSLSEQVTDYKRQVDDLNFRLEELSVISGDQLEKVAMRDSGELEELRKELEIEQEKNASLQGELLNTKQQVQSLSTQAPQHDSSEELQKLRETVEERDSKIHELERSNKFLREEIDKSKQELQSAESDYKVTEAAVESLQSDLDTTHQQLQETLDLCAQQEGLLEDKVKELETVDEQNRNLKKDIERMTGERQQLVALQEQVSSERDEALKQCEDLMSQSTSISNEQTQLAKQRAELLQERDQSRAELRDTSLLLEQVVSERDDLQHRLDELSKSREEDQGRSQEFSLQLDSTQNDLESARVELGRIRRQSVSLSEQLDNEKMISEQKIELAEATCLELRERLDRANEERDSALQQAQSLSDRFSKKDKQVEELRENAIKAHNHIQTLEEQLEDVTRSRDALTQESQLASGAVQEELEELEARVELRERELQEAKERIVSLEDELVISQSSSGLQNDQRLAELEEDKMLLEEKLTELADRLHEVSSKQEDTQPGNDEQLLKTLGEKDQEISFLKSVITDQQTKISTLEELNGLGENANAMMYLDSSEDDILASQLPPPRVFCDICDEFDQHDTADCPQQAQTFESSPNTQHHAHRSHERPYCENCEVFGHWTEECDFEETY